MRSTIDDMDALERHAKAAENDGEAFIRAGSFKLGRLRLQDAVALRARIRARLHPEHTQAR